MTSVSNVLLQTLPLLQLLIYTAGDVPFINNGEAEGELGALNSLLSVGPQTEPFILLIMDKHPRVRDVEKLWSPRGIAIFEVGEENISGPNFTQTEFSRVIPQARLLRLMCWAVTVVVVSDDPAFLTTFAEWSLKGRLLVWSTRLIVLTRLPFSHLEPLRKTFSMTNSILVHCTSLPNTKCKVYVELPYLTSQQQPLTVAQWSPERGMVFRNKFIFPNKFHKLEGRPELRVARVLFPSTKVTVVDDPEAPGGKRVVVFDPMVTLFETIAEAMDFSIQYLTPIDFLWGVKLSNGSWNGMVGMMIRQEVDMALGPFGVTAEQAEVVDFTYPAFISYARTIHGQGSPEVDPWGFLLPLGSFVWVLILGALAVMMLLPFVAIKEARGERSSDMFLRVLLQQDISERGQPWLWERVAVGVWMLTTLVLTKSYAGNLMSLLAVRHIPMPIQSLQDIVNNPVTLLLQKASVHTHAFLGSEQGILRDVGDLEKLGRMQGIHAAEFVPKLHTEVRRGDHVLITEATMIKMMMAHDFSGTGSCDFYLSREEFLPMMFSSAGPKGTPLIPALSRRYMRVTEAGLFNKLTKLYTPNFTSCLNPSTKVALKTSLSIINIWGMLVVLVGGWASGSLVFFLEKLLNSLLHH